jgi:multidrug efflux system membrane fusion protein
MTLRATASVAVVLATVIVTMLGGCGQVAKDPSASTKATAQAPPPEVTAAAFQTRLLPEYLEVTGRIEAVREVDVRCRITGYLTKIFFRDGQFVKAGDPLYEIDPRPYVAQLESAKGSLEKLLGERRFAEVQVARYEKLSAKGAASVQEFDTWKAKLEENTGAVAAARAEVEFARLNVEFCTVTSPIDGQIGRTQLQIGNLINQDSTTLAMVVSIDPIHVYFNVDEPTFIRVVRTMRGESEPAMVDRRQFVVDIGLVDDRERRYPYRCVVDFLNNQVDPQTATITVRGVLENPHDPNPAHPRPPLFRSGMFIRARLPLGKPADVTLVPEAAIGSNQDRKVLWLVAADGTAHSHEVVPGQKVGAWVAVRSADAARPLDASDRVVVRGLQRCREGKPVTVVMAAAETIGLDTLPTASGAVPAPLPPASPASGVSTAPAAGAVETLPRPAGVTASPEPSGQTPP